jgi:DNA-binding XRE family transcriptional regulator
MRRTTELRQAAREASDCQLEAARRFAFSDLLSGEQRQPKMTEPIYRHIGAKVQQMRTLLDLKQEEVAKRCGLTRTSIANIEAGRQRILLHDVETIAKAFGTTPRALLKGMWD